MSGSYYALDAAYNSLQSQLISLNAEVDALQSLIATPSLANITQNLTQVSIGAVGTITSVSFIETLNIPSAGKWLITGNFLVNYIISAPNPTTTTEGFLVSGFGGLAYYDLGTLTGKAIPNGLSISKNFSVSTLYTATAPISLSGSGGVINSQYGTTFEGSVFAIKISP